MARRPGWHLIKTHPVAEMFSSTHRSPNYLQCLQTAAKYCRRFVRFLFLCSDLSLSKRANLTHGGKKATQQTERGGLRMTNLRGTVRFTQK